VISTPEFSPDGLSLGSFDLDSAVCYKNQREYIENLEYFKTQLEKRRSMKIKSKKRKYWSDIFSEKTWGEFLENGACVTGFRRNRENTAKRVRPGDYLLCYLTRKSVFIGVLRVKSHHYLDDKPIWRGEDELPPISWTHRKV
jgi:hypothetical protein